tara:strand:- start:548 stop:1528 length:981 start_codon:yes stop_codon:yes gene_type:complete
MKNQIKNTLKLIHLIFSQFFTFQNLLKEYISFNKLKKINKNKFNVELRKNDLFFIEKSWISFHDEIVKDTNNLSYLFFKKPSLLKTMTNDAFFAEYELLLEKSLESFDYKELKKLMKENSIGGPKILLNSIFSTKFKFTSISRAAHIYQLSKIQNIIKNENLKKLKTIIEWGGGYGGLCNVFYKHYGFDGSTYIIIDIPVSIKMQYYYLATIYGSEKINIFEDNNQIQTGKINLVRLSELQNFNCKCDIFISSWAISESNKNSQDFVLKKYFYDALYTILFHQEKSKTHPYAEYLSEIMKDKYEVIENDDVPILINQHYLITKNKN